MSRAEPNLNCGGVPGSFWKLRATGAGASSLRANRWTIWPRRASAGAATSMAEATAATSSRRRVWELGSGAETILRSRSSEPAVPTSSSRTEAMPATSRSSWFALTTRPPVPAQDTHAPAPPRIVAAPGGDGSGRHWPSIRGRGRPRLPTGPPRRRVTESPGRRRSTGRTRRRRFALGSELRRVGRLAQKARAEAGPAPLGPYAVRDNAPRRRVQPEPGLGSAGDVREPAPGRQEDVRRHVRGLVGRHATHRVPKDRDVVRLVHGAEVALVFAHAGLCPAGGGCFRRRFA